MVGNLGPYTRKLYIGALHKFQSNKYSYCNYTAVKLPDEEFNSEVKASSAPGSFRRR
ncbi:hypothetical protein MTR_0793s0010 [Medicago truncatula]|uniref:Uncharacterized protein n=1 Tax=Medicago truncatula TaxID=3880 RepID=A0A072TDE2_MEDTR|nr:hypothetical protein MTR_0793s0010 [Medicago truncatula]